jgi:topoisomerase-4 subunit B
VNGQYTRYGGTHLAAFREAVAKVLKEFYKRNYTPEDCRQGIAAALSIRIQEPNFDGQKKSRLGSVYMWEKDGQQGPTIKLYIQDFLSRLLPNYLLKHKELSELLEAKIKQSQAEREQIASVRSSKSRSTRRASVYNENLNDCQYHYCDRKNAENADFLDRTTLFITEGNSAAGTVNKARNPKYQAAFSIRGKSMNCYKESSRKVAENKEFNNLVAALGVEDGMKGLRYAKVVIASDADTDGMHIRMLLMTFFLKFYPDLVSQGFIHILETPLFRVRNKKESRYCYSEQEKDQALIDLGRGSEITRFKGLGELGEKEFKDFIGPDMKLEQVCLEDGESVQMILEFYMGSNTKDRQDFIFANLKSQEDLDGV